MSRDRRNRDTDSAAGAARTTHRWIRNRVLFGATAVRADRALLGQIIETRDVPCATVVGGRPAVFGAALAAVRQ